MSAVIGFPVGLSVLLLITARLESRFLAPDERAEKLHGVLQAAAEPNEVEELASRLARQAMPVAGLRAGHGRRFRREPSSGASRAAHRRTPRLDTSQGVA